jgi:hypothetical protein
LNLERWFRRSLVDIATKGLPLAQFNPDSAVETQWDMRTKIALTIQLLIHRDFNCAAVETGESRKMPRCPRPQPTITFSATESFHNQLRNPGLTTQHSAEAIQLYSLIQA